MERQRKLASVAVSFACGAALKATIGRSAAASKNANRRRLFM
jgi:hypothetical protein